MSIFDKFRKTDDKVVEDLEDLKTRVKQLECPHTNTVIEAEYPYPTTYIEKCQSCGKILRGLSEREMLEEKLCRAKADVKQLFAKIKNYG